MDQSLNVADTLELLLVVRDSQLDLIQWWVSATLVLIAIAYFGRKQLNPKMALAVLLLYVPFSYAMVHMGFQLTVQQTEMARYLTSTWNEDVWTRYLIDIIATPPLPVSFYTALAVALGGAFLVAAGLLVMCINRRSENARSPETAHSGRGPAFDQDGLMAK